MHRITARFLVFVLAFSISTPMFAQDQSPQAGSKAPAAQSPYSDFHYYRLDFVVREIGEDGKVANSRGYSILVGSDNKNPGFVRPASIRTGSKVPFFANGSKTIDYQDVGVNIDCQNVLLLEDGLALHVGAEVSSVANAPASIANATQDANDSAPVIRQNKWESEVVLPLGKPTILFSSDNVATKGKLQLELTATPIK